MNYQVGDKVHKISGYSFPGTVVSVFKTTAGEDRLVVELDNHRLLHIFNFSQMEKCNEQT